MTAEPTCSSTGDGPVVAGGPGSVEGLHEVLERAALTAAPGLDVADCEAVVNAAALRCARNHPHPVPGGGGPDQPVVLAGQLATAAVEVAALSPPIWGLPPAATQPVDWSGFGLVVPVLAGSPGAGASVLAVALADAIARHDHRVLLVDAADPARSGLAAITLADGPWLVRPHPQLGLRYSWRGSAPSEVLVARMESALPAIIPGMVPPPPVWAPSAEVAVAPTVTVIDIGHDGWRAVANPLVGAGAWLREGDPPPGPVLVIRGTRPSVRHAEQVLARLEPWIAAGTAAPVEALVVMGVRRWPAGVPGAAGTRLGPLVETAVFCPFEPRVAIGGVTPDPLPPRLLAALAPLLARWGVTAPPGRRSGKATR